MDEMNSYEEPNFIILGDQPAQEEEHGQPVYETEPAPSEEFIYTKEPEKKKKDRKFLKLISLLLLSGIMGFIGGMAGFRYGASNIQPDFGYEPPGQIILNPNEDLNTAEAIATKVIPSVVGISITKEIPRLNLFGMEQGQMVQGVGTGFIVHKDGYILTNSHVVGDGEAKTIVVQLTDGRELTGTVLWNDVILDLAMVKIDASNLTAAELGDSSTVNIGAYAVAIGNPLGLAFDRSVTQGVISGLDRTITVNSGGRSVKMEGLMQTDASINSGNSGGPLLNNKGQVIGINSAKAASAEGLGFAIPINTAKPIIEEIMRTGSFKKAYIGVSVEDVSLFLQYYPDSNLGTKKGAYVSQVHEGSPAALAGIQQGDAIVNVDDKAIENKEQLIKILFSYKPGDSVKISLFRNGRKMMIDLTLGTSPG